MNFGHFGWLFIEAVGIFTKEISGFYIGHVFHLAIEDVDIFCRDVSIFRALK